MYAVTHSATALLITRRFPEVGLIKLLVAVQLVETMWVVLTYIGLEHVEVVAGTVHLSYLPFSHSIATGVGLAVAAWAGGALAGHRRVGLALGLGIVSHVLLDVIHHEPDIVLWPFWPSPRFGFNLASLPLVDFLVELAFSLACWRVFKGRRHLLTALIGLNIINLPLMLPPSTTSDLVAASRAVLPTIILAQMVITSAAIWFFARQQGASAVA